jgi:hypothetical protein
MKPELLPSVDELQGLIRAYGYTTHNQSNELAQVIRNYLIDTRASPTPPEAKGESGWISVEDRLPDEYGSVLAVCTLNGDKNPTVNEAFYILGEWNLVRNNVKFKDVTHWQPQPALPLIPSIEQREG